MKTSPEKDIDPPEHFIARPSSVSLLGNSSQFDEIKKHILRMAPPQTGEGQAGPRLVRLTPDLIVKGEMREPHDFELTGIAVSLNSISEEGLPIRFRRGECFGEKIEWTDPENGFLVLDQSCNLLEESGINIVESIDDDRGYGYAGWEEKTKTWWRYAKEAQPGVYREHCLQILSIQELNKDSKE